MRHAGPIFVGANLFAHSMAILVSITRIDTIEHAQQRWPRQAVELAVHHE
jgi:hypothetical protein